MKYWENVPKFIFIFIKKFIYIFWLIYYLMKIILEKGPDHIITLTNGTREVTNEIIDRVSDEILRKCS